MTRQTNIALTAPDGAQQLGEPIWGGGLDPKAGPTGPRILGLGRAFLRHGKLLFAVVMVLNLLAFMGVRNLTPRYTASADLIVGPREEQVVDLKAVLSGLSGSSDVIESEIQVLRSRQVARSVVQSLKLDQMVEFNPALQPPGFRRMATETAQDAAAWAMAQFAAASLMLGIDPQKDRARDAAARALPPDVDSLAALAPPDPLSIPVDRFLSQLDVASKGRSRVITVSFTSTNSALAAMVPNAVADAYIVNQLAAKTRATAQATRWLEERVAEMREQLLNADEAVEAYRRRAGIVPIRDSTLLNQQISEAGQNVMRAREQVALAEGRVASMASLNPNAAGLQRELAAAQSRQKSLEANLATLRQQIDAGSQSEIGLRALQREADADRNLYDKLLARARETRVQSGLQQADASVISRAERQDDPSFPKPGIILPLFFVASCIVGLLLVLWLESIDRGVTSPDHLEALLGVPALASIPLVRRGLLRKRALGMLDADNPKSSFAESIRNLHTGLILSGKDSAPKTVLVASSLPGEGKSSVVVALAAMMASCNKRVVVVDCDLRNPSVDRHFGVARAPGLMECLMGNATLEEALVKAPGSNAHVLTAGGEAMVAPDVFATAAMRNLLRALSSNFDLVLLDGGPVLGTADTRHLCRVADCTVFVVRWQDTRCAAAAIGLRQLLNAGANVAGAILTMVHPKQHRLQSPARMYRKKLAAYIEI